MSTQQRLNPFTAGAHPRERGGEIGVGGGELANVRGVGRVHASSVAVETATMPHQTADEATTTDHLSTVDLSVLIPLALSRAGLSHKQACAYMEIDPSNWSKALQGVGGMHVSFQRLLKLPIAFWTEFVPLIAEPIGLAVTNEDIADRALLQMSHAVDVLVRSAVAVRRAQRRVG